MTSWQQNKQHSELAVWWNYLLLTIILFVVLKIIYLEKEVVDNITTHEKRNR